jgi:hypothetical protein
MSRKMPDRQLVWTGPRSYANVSNRMRVAVMACADSTKGSFVSDMSPCPVATVTALVAAIKQLVRCAWGRVSGFLLR